MTSVFENLAVAKGNRFLGKNPIPAAEDTSVLNCCESNADRDLSKILEIESSHPFFNALPSKIVHRSCIFYYPFSATG